MTAAAETTPERASQFLGDQGEMARLIAQFDWGQTRLGAINTWQPTVRSTVGMMLRSPLPIATLWGEEGVMIYNDAYAVVAGARHPDLLGMEVRAAWPEVADFNDVVIREVLGKGGSLSFQDQELTLDRGAGPAPAWMNLDYSPIVGDDGAPLGVIAFVVETTGRVRADRRLQDERARLQQMFDQAPSYMALFEGPEHRFVLTNPAYQGILDQSDVLGQPAAAMAGPLRDSGHFDPLGAVFSTGKPRTAPESAYAFRAAPGSPAVTRFLEFVYQPIRNSDGLVWGVLVSGTDVTEQRLAQQAIRDREAQFRTFAEVMPNHVWTSLPDGQLDWVNKRFSGYGNKPGVDLLKEGWAALAHPEDRPGATAAWHAALESGDIFESELRLVSATGEPRWHLVRALPLHGETGQILRWIGTNTDIHSQKLSEMRTGEDRDRLWTLSQDLMLICDYEGRITAVNPSATRLLGWDPCEMAGQLLSDFLHPEDRARTEREVKKLAQGVPTLAFENRYRQKDGGFRLLEWTAVPDGGRIHGIGRDISEERRLARERERIWNISPVLKVTTSRSGRIASVNPAWTQQLGWSAGDSVGRSVFSFVLRSYRRELVTQFRKLQEGAPSTPFMTVVRTQMGEEKVIEWKAVREGDTVFGFGRDITSEMEAAAALASSETALRQAQKMEAIGQLTGGIAHDFNNLLQVVGGNLQLLSDQVASDPKAAGRLASAMDGVHRGARLASQLLAFGRKQPLAPKVVHLGRLVGTMDAMLRQAVGEAVEMEVRVADDLWHTVIDPGNVENALLNLAINARDAMDARGRLTIELQNTWLDDAYVRDHPDIAAGPYVALSVTDTGSGMTPEVLSKVFEPFYSTKPEGKGSGLGLSMVYGFVRQTGGHIRIYSEPGEGTSVRIFLPRSTEAEDDIRRFEPGPVRGGHETILVAEDDPGVRDTVVQTLEDLGYSVLQATQAAEALAMIESGAPVDLLFTDVVMPGQMKAAELAERARAVLPGLAVLFTSGYPEHSIVHGGRLDAGVELLSKPYSRDAIAARIREVLDNASRKQPSPSGQSVRPTLAKASVAPLTVLLCEDDVLIRMATQDMLEERGYTVLDAGDGATALSLLADHAVDVLLTDVGLPDMSGLELAGKARTLTPGLPVVFVTGHSSPQDADLEASAWIQKPFDAPVLYRTISRLREETQA